MGLCTVSRFPPIWILVYHFNLHIFPKKLQHYTIQIYIVFKFFIPSAFQKYNICWIYGVWSRICVFLYLCICLFAILDTHNYILWGPVLSRNHCRQTFILYIRVYMPSAECTLLRSRRGGGGAIFLKVHLPVLTFIFHPFSQHSLVSHRPSSPVQNILEIIKSWKVVWLKSWYLVATLPYGCNARFHNGQWLTVWPEQDLIVILTLGMVL